MLLSAPFESDHMLKELSDMTLERVSEASLSVDSFIGHCNDSLLVVTLNSELKKAAEQAYAAWLGFYKSHTKKLGNWSREQLVEAANCFSKTLGLREIPYLEKRLVGKMGLNGVKGLRIK